MKSAKKKIEVSGGMSVRAYDVFHRAVEDGISYGWQRAHKHTDSPSDDAVRDEILNGVINAVSEYFDFDSDDGE